MDMLSAFSLRNLGVILSGSGAEMGRRAFSIFLTLEGVNAMSRGGSWTVCEGLFGEHAHEKLF